MPASAFLSAQPCVNKSTVSQWRGASEGMAVLEDAQFSYLKHRALPAGYRTAGCDAEQLGRLLGGVGPQIWGPTISSLALLKARHPGRAHRLLAGLSPRETA